MKQPYDFPEVLEFRDTTEAKRLYAAEARRRGLKGISELVRTEMHQAVGLPPPTRRQKGAEVG